MLREVAHLYYVNIGFTAMRQPSDAMVRKLVSIAKRQPYGLVRCIELRARAADREYLGVGS